MSELSISKFEALCHVPDNYSNLLILMSGGTKYDLLSRTSSKEKYLIVIDNEAFRSAFWEAITLPPNIKVTLLEDVKDYIGTYNNLILDMHPMNYTYQSYRSYLSEGVFKIKFSTCWIILETSIDYYRYFLNGFLTTIKQNIDEISNSEFKIVNIEPMDKCRVQLHYYKLDSIAESDFFEYKLGIPFNKGVSSFKNFIPAMEENLNMRLAITEEDKYNLLADTLELYRKLRLDLTDNKKATESQKRVARTKFEKSFKKVRHFLDNKRVRIIQNMLDRIDTFSDNRVLLFRDNDPDGIFKQICKLYNVFSTEDPHAVSIYRNHPYGILYFSDVNTVGNLKNITKYVILANVSILSLKDIKTFLDYFDCDIIVPIFIDTMDENVAQRIQQKHKCKIIYEKP